MSPVDATSPPPSLRLPTVAISVDALKEREVATQTVTSFPVSIFFSACNPKISQYGVSTSITTSLPPIGERRRDTKALSTSTEAPREMLEGTLLSKQCLRKASLIGEAWMTGKFL